MAIDLSNAADPESDPDAVNPENRPDGQSGDSNNSGTIVDLGNAADPDPNENALRPENRPEGGGGDAPEGNIGHPGGSTDPAAPEDEQAGIPDWREELRREREEARKERQRQRERERERRLERRRERRRSNAKAALAGSHGHIPAPLRDQFIQGWVDTGSAAGGLRYVREAPEYGQFFPGNKMEDGRLRLNEGDYMRYQDSVQKIRERYELPPGQLDTREQVGQYIEQDLSIDELATRVEDYWFASKQAPQEVKAELERQYDVTEGELLAFWMNPEESEKQLQRKLSRAQISAAGRMTGFGRLNSEEANRLVQLGVDMQGAREGLAQGRRVQELQQGVGPQQTPGEDDDMERGEILDAIFESDFDSQQTIQRLREARRSRFEGGDGGPARSQTGLIGLGTQE